MRCRRVSPRSQGFTIGLSVAAAVLAGVRTISAEENGQAGPRPCAAAGAPGAIDAIGNPQLLPRDEAGRRSDFAAFRRQLQEVASRRDAAALLALVHPEVRVGFDGADGRDAFRKNHIEDPDKDFWTELGNILALGGAFYTPDEFHAPYVFSEWPAGLDPLCYAVTGSGVRMREAPAPDGRVVAALDYAVVEPIETRVSEWQHVRLADGRTGYVAVRYLRSPIDYRAGFEFREGRWWLVFFAAGD